MEEIKSQVSFELDTTLKGNYTLDFTGQNVIIHALRSSHKEATITLKGNNIRFRKFPKVNGLLKIVTSNLVYFPKKLEGDHIQIDPSSQHATVWNTESKWFGLNERDDYEIPKRIKTKEHSVAMVSFVSDFAHSVSLHLPRCNVIVADCEATNNLASLSVTAQNIWVLGNQEVKAGFYATNSWAVRKGMELKTGTELVSPKHFWPSENGETLQHELPKDVIPLFHLPKAK